ncbi:hypothetical protein XAC3810_450009 [Xanthomonas citri pv. citri]|uniref:Uncharacterized protein n=1 Tax=Xanthomonas citri pv. citri TaxID=611301 RepID=A0A0U5BUD9_XANCI|nr:hypothetical protein XAC9322_460008 [Xanthomonas citri pv. citri]CEE30471.1 hypothetical protein XAC1083_450008 [Xanthomonas citri pv. citri]CEE39676.1 hypothetical protein XAC3810_450009 [Xanthomonas citri pv. citri]CEE66807.1 hypothetical protein XACW160_460009 [Xanthomonas citri pv. citri]CEE71617.1 hypothetical protein XAC2852_470246 [Xanthomonas citri pv. citri]
MRARFVLPSIARGTPLHRQPAHGIRMHTAVPLAAVRIAVGRAARDGWIWICTNPL